VQCGLPYNLHHDTIPVQCGLLYSQHHNTLSWMVNYWVKPSTYATQPRINTFLLQCFFTPLVHMIVITPLDWFWYFHNLILYFDVPNTCNLYPWRWPHGWPKHVVHCVQKLIFMYLCAFVGTVVVYISYISWSCMTIFRKNNYYPWKWLKFSSSYTLKAANLLYMSKHFSIHIFTPYWLTHEQMLQFSFTFPWKSSHV
jgi:hypothetical protein